MTFVAWLGTIALPSWYKTSAYFVAFIPKYFSVSYLMETLFSPWKRQVDHDRHTGFDLSRWFNTFSYNLISRCLGAIIRFSTIIFALYLTVFALLLSIIVCLIFTLISPLLFPLYLKYRADHPPYPKNGTSADQIHWLVNLSHTKAILIRAGLNPDTVSSTLNTVPLKPFKASADLMDVFTYYFSSPPAQKLLNTHHLTLNDLELVHDWLVANQLKKRQISSWWTIDFLKALPVIGTGWTAGYTPVTNQFGRDLSTEDLRLLPFSGREKEIERLVQTLTKPSMTNALIVSDPGTGRERLIEGLGQAIQLQKIKPLLMHRTIIINTDLLVASALDPAASNIFYSILNEASAAGKTILVLPHLERLMENSYASQAFSAALDKTLDNREIEVIATTTPSKLQSLNNSFPEIIQKFTLINLSPLNKSQMLRLLLEHLPALEAQYQLFFTLPGLKQLIELCLRHLPSQPFPTKAIELINQVISQNPDKPVIDAAYINQVFSQVTGIPVGIPGPEETGFLLNLETNLKKVIVDQDPAIETLAQALRRSRANLETRPKPMGTFLFIGPTGVGKTETAKAINHLYFKNMPLIRFDMAEFQTPEAVDRLIGSVNHHDPGLLASAISKQPYGVLLLDEFEKSPQFVHNLFLNILDEGYFTDASGHRIDCTHLLIIATSNAGSELIRQYLQSVAGTDGLDRFITEYLLTNHIFPPELLNRFDAVVCFKPLTQTGLKQVVALQLKRLIQSLTKNHQLTVTIAQNTIDDIVKNGYDSQFGARSVERYILSTVADQISKKILQDPSIETLTI